MNIKFPIKPLRYLRISVIYKKKKKMPWSFNGTILVSGTNQCVVGGEIKPLLFGFLSFWKI